MRRHANFIGEEAVAEALRLSEMLFEKKKDYQEEEKKVSSSSPSSSFRDDGELKLRKVKEKTKTTSDGDGGKEEDQKKGEAKAYRKYDSIEKPSCTNDQTSSKATHSVVREHRSILVKMSKKKSGGEDVGKRKDRMKNPGDALEVGDLLKPRAANCLRCGKDFSIRFGRVGGGRRKRREGVFRELGEVHVLRRVCECEVTRRFGLERQDRVRD